MLASGNIASRTAVFLSFPKKQECFLEAFYLHGNTSRSQTSRLHATGHCVGGQSYNTAVGAAGRGICVSCSIRRAHAASRARARAVPICDGNIDVATNEAKVDHQGDEGGCHVTREATDEEDTNKRVNCANDGNSFDGLEASWNSDVMIYHGCEKI